jgi:hypothetical protein
VSRLANTPWLGIASVRKAAVCGGPSRWPFAMAAEITKCGYRGQIGVCETHPAESGATYSLTLTLYRARSHNVRYVRVQHNSRREDGIARLKKFFHRKMGNLHDFFSIRPQIMLFSLFFGEGNLWSRITSFHRVDPSFTLPRSPSGRPTFSFNG